MASVPFNSRSGLTAEIFTETIMYDPVVRRRERYRSSVEFRQQVSIWNKASRTRRIAADPIKQARYDLNRRLKYRYQITVDEYDWLLGLQRNCCALCGQESMTGGPRNGRLSVDHVHGSCGHASTRFACKKCIRGLLCDGCNHRCLPWAEKDMELQGPRVREYLTRRPFKE